MDAHAIPGLVGRRPDLAASPPARPGHGGPVLHRDRGRFRAPRPARPHVPVHRSVGHRAIYRPLAREIHRTLRHPAAVCAGRLRPPQPRCRGHQGPEAHGAKFLRRFQLGTEVKLLEAHTAGNNDPFEAQLDWCQRQYDSAILGHSQMTGVQKGVGGKMQGSQATQQFEDVPTSRLRTLSAAMSNTLGKTLVARNFSPKIADLHAPSIKLRFADRDDPEILSKVALTLFQAGAGELIGSEDLVRRCTMRLAIGDEKNLGKPAAGASGGAGSTSMPMSAAENRQMLTAIANADSHEYKAIRTVIAGYVESEKKRALAYGKKRLAAVKK